MLRGITSVPDSHPARKALDNAIRNVFDEVPGNWIVSISFLSASWTLTAQRSSDGFHRTVTLGPEDQSVGMVEAELRGALRDLE
jgi:hypothetical protein